MAAAVGDCARTERKKPTKPKPKLAMVSVVLIHASVVRSRASPVRNPPMAVRFSASSARGSAGFDRSSLLGSKVCVFDLFDLLNTQLAHPAPERLRDACPEFGLGPIHRKAAPGRCSTCRMSFLSNSSMINNSSSDAQGAAAE